MLLYLFKSFIRSKATLIGLAFILLAGTVSIVIGKRFLQQQQESVALTITQQEHQIAKQVQFHKDDLGLLLYYLKFAIINEPSPLAGVSIGQRDVNPSIQSVTIRNLESQQYDTDLNNPSNLLLGNLDLGFVLLYLFPLLIIAFTYNVLSEEKEGGTWNMVRLYTASPIKVLLQKLGIRLGVVYGMAILLLAIAVIVLSIPFTAAFGIMLLLLALYLVFWFVLSYWVISWQQSSAFNAVSLLAFWVGLTILAPALVNSYISNAYPVPEAIQTAVKQRQGYHEKWDMDKQPTMDKFYAHYPQFRKYPLPDTQFSWLWYYAMQQMGDDEAMKESKELKEKLWQRDKVSSRLAVALPVLHTQLALNNLAGTGLQNHLIFLERTGQFHEKMRLFFYSHIFENRTASVINWNDMKVQYVDAEETTNALSILLPLLLISALLFTAGHYNFYRYNRYDQYSKA
jgi:ABC-2 type transport system permease protein